MSYLVDNVPGAYYIRHYHCPARTGFPWNYHIAATVGVALLALNERSSPYCEYCAVELHPDRQRKMSYTREFVIVEEPW